MRCVVLLRGLSDSSGLRRTIACFLSRSLHTPRRRALARTRPPLISIHPTPVLASLQQNERAAGTDQIIGASPVRVNPGFSTGPSSQNTELSAGSLLFSRHLPRTPRNLAGKNALILWRSDCYLHRDKHPGGDLKCVVEVPWLEKKLHSIDGIAHQPGVRLPSPEDFQEASDWPSTKGRFREAALLSKLRT
jgi:hypothetical protein